MSDGDELLEELGAMLRAEDPEREADARAEWEAWERLAAGEDDEALNDEERREAFTPFDEAALDRFAERASAALEGSEGEPAGEEPSAPPATVTPIDSRRRWWIAGAVVLAAAVIIVLVWRPRPDAAGLGEYTMTVTAGDRPLRSDGEPEPGEARLAPESRFELVLRPAETRAEPDVRTFLVVDGAREPWDVPTERSSTGAVRIAGRAAELFGERAGPVRVEVELRAAADDDPATFGVEVVLEAAPP